MPDNPVQHAESVAPYGYRYHVPTTHNVGDPPPPILLTVDGQTEVVADYFGLHYVCQMATLGYALDGCPGRLGRLARWIVRRQFDGGDDRG